MASTGMATVEPARTNASSSAGMGALFCEDRRATPKEERLEVVKALREDGHSPPAIAGALGVSLGTAQRDAAGLSPDKAPDRVTGRDGKSYPGRKEPKPEARRSEASGSSICPCGSRYARACPTASCTSASSAALAS